MKLIGHKLYFKNGEFLNLHIFAEHILLPITVFGGIGYFYWLMIKLPTWWAMFH